MPRPLLICMAMLLGIGGCGEGEVASSHRDIAAEALLTSKDLPVKVKVEGGLPPELCGPTEIFQDNRGKFAETKMFKFDGIRAQEAVGVFPHEGLAKLAFKRLTSRGHGTCIGNTITSFGRPQDTVNVSRSKKLEAGVESSVFYIRVVREDSGLRGIVAVPSIRRGRCVSALIIFGANKKRLRREASKIVGRADLKLADAC